MTKKEWRESSSGPDCLDVMVILKAISTLHDMHVALIVSPSEDGFGMCADIALSALADVLPGSDLPAAIGVHNTYPNSKGTSFWGECYRLAWALDADIGRAYKQKSLVE